MLVKDIIEKCDKDLASAEILDQLANHDRQVDLVFNEERTDGYLTWDRENWTSVDGKRFIRSYFLKGRALSEFSTFNKYDCKAEFKPEEATEVILG